MPTQSRRSNNRRGCLACIGFFRLLFVGEEPEYISKGEINIYNAPNQCHSPATKLSDVTVDPSRPKCSRKECDAFSLAMSGRTGIGM